MSSHWVSLFVCIFWHYQRVCPIPCSPHCLALFRCYIFFLCVCVISVPTLSHASSSSLLSPFPPVDLKTTLKIGAFPQPLLEALSQVVSCCFSITCLAAPKLRCTPLRRTMPRAEPCKARARGLQWCHTIQRLHLCVLYTPESLLGWNFSSGLKTCLYFGFCFAVSIMLVVHF